MQNQQAALRDISVLEAKAARAAQMGRDQEAITIWGRILDIDPNHARTLTMLGQHAFRTGDTQSARTAFQRVVDTDGKDPQQWINLALACQSQKDEQGEESAIQRALTLAPSDLLALILRANLLERQGKMHKAASVYGAVTAVSPPLEQLHPDLRPAVTHAFKWKEKYDNDCGTFLDQFLDPYYKEFTGEKLNRFRDSVDIMIGRKKRYDSQSVFYHFPNLAPIEFFERADFPWLDPIEAATDDIRNEFLEVLHAEDGFEPYITYPQDVPHNQFAELNNSPRWSAFHLYKMGKLVEGNAAMCPATMKLLAGAPQPDQPGRTPAAMFSLLKPRTRIPPHTGVTNARLVTHLPLIIPEDCGFRVGNDTREWVPGKAWVFDDTIEHEAWNDSDKLRVVFIFDVWHPHLSEPERAMITAMAAGINAFSGGEGSFEI
jgi:aspartyl/asparaginyl beta-hydroxylase (cupin superfamily)